MLRQYERSKMPSGSDKRVSGSHRLVRAGTDGDGRGGGR